MAAKVDAAASFVDKVEGEEEEEQDEQIDYDELGRRLLSAAKRGDVEAAQRVVDVTGDVAVKDDAGWTPLMHAASRGHVAVASMLLRNGAATEYKQQRARFMAEFEAGFRVEDVDVHANTLLHLAASSGSASALECVMSQGFDLAATNRFGNTARDLATAPAVAALFVSATAHPACPITHIEFVAPQLRYRCTCCGGTFAQEACVAEAVVMEDGAAKPVRYCRNCLSGIREAEEQLATAMSALDAEDLTPLQRAVEAARGAGASVAAVQEGERVRLQRQMERELMEATQEVERRRPLARRNQAALLVQRIGAARQAGANPALVARAARLTKVVFAECALQSRLVVCKHIEHASLAHLRDMQLLEEALEAVKALAPKSPLVPAAVQLRERLRAEVELTQAQVPHTQETAPADAEAAAAPLAEDGSAPAVAGGVRYLLEDGTVTHSLLEALQLRQDRLTVALEAANSAGVASEHVHKGRRALEALVDELRVERAAEEERKRLEEEERQRRERKGKRKGKKK